MPPERPWLVVLARDPAEAKTRLAAHLRPGERARLVQAMLEDVVEAAVAARIARVLVATESEVVRQTARRYGVDTIAVPPRGTREAAASAFASAAAAGASAVAVVASDLPALRPIDVTALFRKGTSMTIAPDRHRRGTNALALRPPDALAPLFGPDSFQAHVAAARQAGLVFDVVERAGLALDIDSAEDLQLARSTGPLGPRTTEVLSSLRDRVETRTPHSMT